MYTRILVPLDGSALAERVLPHVEALAMKFDSTVMLLRVTTAADALAPTPSMAVGPFGVPAAGPIFDRVAFAREEREEAIKYLASLADGLRNRGVDVTNEQREGNPTAVIIEQAGQWPADLIAMTTHGRSGLGRLLLGGVAYDVVRSAPCPVLLVRVSEDKPLKEKGDGS
jgi:nucleotide-binding universal stress UspA family protein